ncbi:MerR family transcriptional regulator [Paenibacillus sinopodophylli]|uniref:MerR family transcriptional regulator n=1 Tax=Paenibacillus sinopodophylli TaxID=1837342 RepID=UPI00110C9D3D|nr:MerR family transcriptional regulator [Paenibacillus sinopodophylli]
MAIRLYTIKEASMRTGVSTQLIRKWEERYEAVKPERMSNGYRGYSKQDIDTLQWLKSQVDDGVPIGMAVVEWKYEHETVLPSEDSGSTAASEPRRGQSYEFYVPTSAEWGNPVEHLLQCFIQLDINNAQRFYEQLLAVHHLEHLLLHILEPALVELGERWERGEISEYQEHFGSHFIRDKMLAIRSLFRPSDDSPLLVTACGPGERHELGILFFGYFAQQEGFRVVYLGSSPSEKGIYDCLADVKPAAFTFSFSLEEQFKAARTFLLQLDHMIREGQLSTKVFIGGRAVREDGQLEGAEHVYLVAGDGKSCIEKIKTRLLSP